ncbi:uncharacterized protein ARMOST_18481 [Armillaria ostoyae]|uniref:Uncharacterized protein n=1 Tax=Armillaria ostoyae TaxID=47428 RepID=A0A284S1V6_ARMOS|nr:uncharacterized protein ARMOST_18481 [Armillaria ostoyae]
MAFSSRDIVFVAAIQSRLQRSFTYPSTPPLDVCCLSRRAVILLSVPRTFSKSLSVLIRHLTNNSYGVTNGSSISSQYRKRCYFSVAVRITVVNTDFFPQRLSNGRSIPQFYVKVIVSLFYPYHP